MSDLESGLYIVPTPIGNMSDITLRALDILSKVKLVACEDPRVTLKIFNFYNLKAPKMVKCTEYMQKNEVEYILGVAAANAVAITSNAGTPLVSDPGHILVNSAVDRGIRIIPLPGCSAIITALSASCMRNTVFVFLGFLPKSLTEKRRLLSMHAATGASIILFENGKRLSATLQLIFDILGNVFIEIARELTKKNEDFWRGDIVDAIQAKREFLGEIVVIINCTKCVRISCNAPTDQDILDSLVEGNSVRTIVNNYPDIHDRRKLYARVQALKNSLDK